MPRCLRAAALALLCAACAQPLRMGQVARPSPDLPGEGHDDDVATDPEPAAEGDGSEPPLADVSDTSDANSSNETATPAGPRVAQESRAQDWLEHALSLWHRGHHRASIDAMHEAIATQDLNDAGQALAYWHIYLSEQALGHSARGHNALADFIAAADGLAASVGAAGGAGETLNTFAQQFDLQGRLARARATLNLAWAQQGHGAGRSEGRPVLVFDDAEMEHFLDLAPPCAKAHDRRVTAVERRADAGGRLTARATIRCSPGQPAVVAHHYFFAYIGEAARATGQGPAQLPRLPQ